MKISSTILWLFVIAIGLEMGAGLYETIIVVPLWANSAPGSVAAYYQLNTLNPEFALNAGPRFWMFFTPTVGLLAIATLLTGFRTSPEHRKWRIAGSIIAIFVIGITFAWFVPNIIRLTYDVPNMSPSEIAVTTKWWVNLNWGRVVFGFAAWICTLQAFRIPQELPSPK